MRLSTTVTTIQILYYRPDARSLLQSFLWQTDDIAPEFPRMRRFLNHWHTNIDAVIAEVLLTHRVGPRVIPVNTKEFLI